MKRLTARFALVVLTTVGILVGGNSVALAATGWLGPASPCAGIQVWVHASESSNLVRADGVRVKLPSKVEGNVTWVRIEQRVDDGRTWAREVSYTTGARDLKVENIPTSFLPWVRPGEGPVALVDFRVHQSGYCTDIPVFDIVSGR